MTKIPSSFNRFLTHIGKLAETAIPARIRLLIVISGADPSTLGALAAKTLAYYMKKWKSKGKKRDFKALYVYHDEFDDAIRLKEEFEHHLEKPAHLELEFSIYEKSEKYLGMTFSFLIMDLTHDLKPNDLGRLIGIVEGGGLVVFLAPPWEKWDTFKTIFKENLTIPQFPEPRHIFISWIKRQLMSHDGIGIYDADNEKVIKKPTLSMEYTAYEKKVEIPEKKMFPTVIYKHALTQDQVNVLKIIEEFFEKPPPGKKKVLVLTADRGRGKSCAIGIGAVGLIHLFRTKKVKIKPRVLVTAPDPSNIQSLMTLASKTLDALGYKYEVIKKEGDVIELRSDNFSIEYWEPITIPKIKGDLVIVDEAAGIHVPLLYKIWGSHDRIIFSSTIHGYEGAGRGFSVRFLKKIKESGETILYEYEMSEPIRYNYNDPVEKWQFDALLLDAEPAQLTPEDLESIEKKELKYIKYDPEKLFSDPEELRQLFGIYVLAHYRNEPDDLGMMADAPHHYIRAVKTKTGKVVCAVQIAQEGPVPRELISELLKGSKIPGNIIPDRFLKHIRLVDFADTVGWRIVRIATHPSVQGKGIGSWVLEKIYQEVKERGLDWLGSGFGVNEELLRFWVKNGFEVIHISPDRNPVSGEYTVLVLRPVSSKAIKLVETAQREFKTKISNSLPVNYRELEPEVALVFLSQPPYLEGEAKRIFTPIELDRLWTYCRGPMTFEAAADLMYKLALLHFWLPPEKRATLSRKQELLLIAKALQGWSWDDISANLGIKVKDAQRDGHEIACIYFEYLTKTPPDEYEPGVYLKDYSGELKLLSLDPGSD